MNKYSEELEKEVLAMLRPENKEAEDNLNDNNEPNTREPINKLVNGARTVGGAVASIPALLYKLKTRDNLTSI